MDYSGYYPPNGNYDDQDPPDGSENGNYDDRSPPDGSEDGNSDKDEENGNALKKHVEFLAELGYVDIKCIKCEGSTYVYKAKKDNTWKVIHLFDHIEDSGLETALRIKAEINPSVDATNLIFPSQISDKDGSVVDGVLESDLIDGQTLDDYIKEHPKHWIYILQQVAASLAVLKKCQIMHNDLHAGNIIIIPTNESPWLPTFRLDDMEVTVQFVNHPCQVFIIDWDRASAEGIFNDKLTENGKDYCQLFGQCNVFQHGYDLFTFLAQFRIDLEKNAWDQVVKTVAKAVTHASAKQCIRDLFKTPVFEGDIRNISRDKQLRRVYSKLYHLHLKYEDHPDILKDKISKLLGSIQTPDSSDESLNSMVKYLHDVAYDRKEFMRPIHAAEWHACLCMGPKCNRCIQELGLGCLPDSYELMKVLYKLYIPKHKKRKRRNCTNRILYTK